MRSIVALVALATAATFWSAPAAAQYDDEEPGGYAVVIQNRKFNMGHEFTLSGGILPLDAFHKGLTGTFRYTFHFDQFQAWEIAGGTYSFNLDTGLKEQLRNNFGVQPDAAGLEQLDGYVETNYVLKPIYGKMSLFNRTLIYSELFFSAGITTAVYRGQDFIFLPGPGFGAGLRFFVWEWLSLRVDMRHYVLFNSVPILDPNSSIENVMALSAGLSFNFGGAG
jgi:outer membrane beta-barrel protein